MIHFLSYQPCLYFQLQPLQAGTVFWPAQNTNAKVVITTEFNKIFSLESPEILLFPTVAFRAAATVWKESYSIVQQKSLGDLYKKLSTGSFRNIAKILYNLKGTIEQLPDLLQLWKRIRKVQFCVTYYWSVKYTPNTRLGVWKLITNQLLMLRAMKFQYFEVTSKGWLPLCALILTL